MSKTAKVFKWITLGLSLSTLTLIIVQSSLDEQTSSASSTWVANIIKTFVNDVFHQKEDVKLIAPEKVSLKLADDYQYNKIANYQPNEIGLGCVKKLYASYEPEETTDKSTLFSASPSDRVNISQSSNGVFIEALSVGDVTITATSKYDGTKKDQYTFSIVDLARPSNFEVAQKELTLLTGQSSYLDIDIKGQYMPSDQLLASRYYDVRKLTYASSNDAVASIDEGIIKANGVGNASISVSNGEVTKTVNVTVSSNPNPIVLPAKLNIHGDKTYCEIMDMNYDSEEKGMHNTKLSVDFDGITPTDSNVKWEIVGNPLIAKVDNKGVVRGYRKLSESNVSFKVKATSISNPNVFATFDMESRHVYPTSIRLDLSKVSKLESGEYVSYVNKTSNFNVIYSPINVTKKDINVTSNTDEFLVTSTNGSSITLRGLKEGITSIKVSSEYDENVSDQVSINCIQAPAINDNNWEQFKNLVRKYLGGHAMLFSIFAISLIAYLYLAHKDRMKQLYVNIAISAGILAGFVLACISELIQYFIPGRTSSMNDVGIDMIGFAIGFAIIYLAILIRTAIKNNKHKRKNNG